jgi:hypothetical protein
MWRGGSLLVSGACVSRRKWVDQETRGGARPSHDAEVRHGERRRCPHVIQSPRGRLAVALDVIKRRLVAVESLGKPRDCTPQAILERHVMLPTEKSCGLAGIGDQPLDLAIGRARPGR